MLNKSKTTFLKSIKNGQEEDFFLLEQAKIILEVLKKTQDVIVEVYISKNANEWVNVFSKYEVEIEIVEPWFIEKISSLKTSGEVIALAKKHNQNLFPFVQANSLVLDSIQDPGNLGTIIRSANWFGIKNIICSKDTVSFYNPKCLQACLGAWLNIAIIYVDLMSFFDSENKHLIYATSLNGLDLRELDAKKIPPAFWVLGNEARGVSKKILDRCKQEISIPKFGDIESLNVGVACGILLYHLKK